MALHKHLPDGGILFLGNRNPQTVLHGDLVRADGGNVADVYQIAAVDFDKIVVCQFCKLGKGHIQGNLLTVFKGNFAVAQAGFRIENIPQKQKNRTAVTAGDNDLAAGKILDFFFQIFFCFLKL